jgi:ABC-type cobalamin/Fe3+-siderophores transport system ATPase subunit
VLIRFDVTNHRSIRDSVELSMVAVDRDRDGARHQGDLGVDLLTVAAIYGANASGKSNVVSALGWVRDAIQDSVKYWDDDIPTDPFAFGSGPELPTEFAVEASIDGVRFEYVLAVNQHEVLYEGLFHYPLKKRRRIFERDRGDLEFQRGLGNLSGTRELLTSRALAISVARRFEEPLVSMFANELLGIRVLGARRRVPQRRADGRRAGFMTRPFGSVTRRIFDDSTRQPALFGDSEEIDTRDRALSLLRLADLGIADVRIVDEEVKGADSDSFISRRVQLIHDTDNGKSALDFVAESEGTKTWFNLIGPILEALSRGSILLFDELDASLHPTLSAEVLRLFQNKATNPRGAQIVFTTHDTSLLNHLNRDEVWLTEKRPDGSTRLGALAEFAGKRVRKSQDLESAYLNGRFGAIPNIQEVEFLRSLGLL